MVPSSFEDGNVLPAVDDGSIKDLRSMTLKIFFAAPNDEATVLKYGDTFPMEKAIIEDEKKIIIIFFFKKNNLQPKT